MRRKLILFILAAFFIQNVFGQSETYTVRRASFSTDKYDEFSPVYYKNGIVFCSNRNTGFSSRTTSQNKGLFKICYIDTTTKAGRENERFLSKNLNSILNDGPVTFNKSRDTIYFSRNLDVTGKLSNLSAARNKLGIFSASLVDGQWTKIRELRINNEWYNVTTPCLSADGKKLFFASDKPGGFGGFDLYYSLWKGDRLEDPVNLGPVINTKGNESYPFVNQSGELLFSSDGIPGGHGGKDIYFSDFSDSTWHTPVCLDEPINSKYDDFGIVTDELMNQGYFSTNRDKSVDIYQFRTNIPQILHSEIQKENNYCFTFADSGQIVIDTTNLNYSWDFGDGVRALGPLVYHCYKGAGKYSVKLNIIERNTGNLFFTKLKYNLELIDFKQPYIHSSDVAVIGERLSFDGLKSNLPGYRVLNYTWGFDNKSRSFGSTAQHTFSEKGEFLVNLELVLQSETSGEMRKAGVSKKILVFTNSKEKGAYLAASASLKTRLPEIGKSENAQIKVQFSAESEFQKDAVFNVELYSSRKKVGVEDRMFVNVPKKYTITEKYIPEDSMYIYIVDQQMTLMAAYPAYNELRSLGIENVKIKTYVLKNPAERDLQHLIKINGAFADSYFDSSDRLTSNAFIMLDQIVKLMNKYPAIKLEVAVHSDNTGSHDTSLALSQSRAHLLISYLINRGINSRRLVGTGFGGSKPIAPNTTERDRKLNRRIDFILLNQ